MRNAKERLPITFEEQTEFIEFSPRQGMDEVLEHVKKQMQAA